MYVTDVGISGDKSRRCVSTGTEIRRGITCNVFHFTLIHNYYGDAMLRTVFMPLYLAVELVFQSFAGYVG